MQEIAVSVVCGVVWVVDELVALNTQKDFMDLLKRSMTLQASSIPPFNIVLDNNPLGHAVKQMTPS